MRVFASEQLQAAHVLPEAVSFQSVEQIEPAEASQSVRNRIGTHAPVENLSLFSRLTKPTFHKSTAASRFSTYRTQKALLCPSPHARCTAQHPGPVAVSAPTTQALSIEEKFAALHFSSHLPQTSPFFARKG